MLRSILSAIGAALKGAFFFVWEALRLPGRLFAGLLGGTADGPPAGDSPLVSDLKSELAERKSLADTHDKIARSVLAWAADSIIDDRPAPVPTWLPRELKNWLPGLTRDEVETLVSSDNQAISAHIREIYALNGVRKVQPLPAAEWPPEPVSVEPAPEFVRYATAPRPAA
ncbi:hypothetical protein [Bradyrhizobium arachidis]|uniref:Uncharacterized protein n=1 Tax=Bradyrhizobium arachidis TaxID=858423 RepID=A0AAE7NK16_9BRAD|nr:hypothetical protein [Bradyrhizobium arachidis]QOZ66392.1 hypothetical protein WN72_08225 [Bradyrhizobium arachidis]SFV18319.1 hypothetical protein SAMN05192541_13436 [Bradyrhizobium arachidis]